jgi:GAF domain-containing protein
VAQRRKGASPKPRSRSPQQTVESLRRSLTREREQRREALEREREALDQQTAISEILGVISNSPTDVKPVLDAVAARAARICDATDARIFLAEGEHYRIAAGFGEVGVVAKVIPLNRDTPSGRAMLDRAPQHIHDIAASSEFSLGREIAGRLGWRTILSVPLLREDRALGTIVLRRKEVRPFNDKQIALLKTFADQAAIAIENARLFNETKEALEQQTATAEILKVIASSPSDVQPVFDAVAANAARVCGVDDVTILRVEDGGLRRVAHVGTVPVLADTRVPMPPAA